MSVKEEQVRATIAEQASEWFVANDEAPLGTEESAALVAWLKASPLHVEEFLGVAGIARDLHAAGTDPEFALEALLARAHAEPEGAVRASWRTWLATVKGSLQGRWQSAAIAAAAAGVAGLGLFLWGRAPRIQAPPTEAAALHFETRHGQQLTERLADNSLLHLNTDSAVTVRYSATRRLVELTSGEADFEVAHEPRRAFTVRAGAAEVVDLGTQFDVRLRPDATIVTVLEGQVAVAPATHAPGGTGATPGAAPRAVRLAANQQITVAARDWPATPVAVDAQRTTAWLHRQISFDHEPLSRVAAEFNRYAPKPIEITAPELRELEVSGVFSTDDTEEFLAFLRSLEGVRVDVTATQIRVSQK